jgi:uncharacterized glyoxalase superfamily protein PhnB
MAKAANPVPQGFRTVTPHLQVKGAAKYIDFLKAAFGGVEQGRAAAPSGKLMHAEVQIGDSRIMLGDEFPEYGSPATVEGNLPFVLHIYVPDADKTFAQAVSAGCKQIMPVADQFWGDRYGQVKDPFGFKWAIATHKEDLTPAEMQERQKKAFGAG